MKSADDLRARLGGNMRESMGSTRPAGTPAAPTSPGSFHGETAKYQGAARVRDALAIEVDRLTPDPDQPRKEFDPEALADLAASLKARGQLQPIRVRYDEPMNRWIIIAGERRYRAALLACLPTLMCVEARGSQSPDEILEDQLVENCLREDLKPIEQARAFKALIDRRGWTYRQLGESLRIAPASITRALALLDLPRDVADQVEAGTLAPSVAYEVARIGDAEVQRDVAARIVAERMTRDEATAEVRRSAGRSKGRSAGKPRPPRPRTFRTAAGRVTVEPKRIADGDPIEVALLESLDQYRAAREGRGGQAA
jgi:ParB family chromosome partitioning protein